MVDVEGVGAPHMDLRTFASYVRDLKPSLFRVLVGTSGHNKIWDGLMALVKEVGYPHKIRPTDGIAETLEKIVPYVEAYHEATDSGESPEGEQTLQLL